MKLSVIIVNYNVKHFLEQCLHSVLKANQQLNAEIFVVDNNSVDGSCAMVQEKFPNVILIENKINVGFSKANNQAMRIAKGEYFLLLNPDTVVEEDTFDSVVQFMDDTPEAGGLGVKMIDGKGTFLPESKRGLPTPMVAFYKIFGLSSLFPKSKTFSKYHLGYLSNDEIHEIEILAGAFMLMRKTTLNKVGLLDEDYFMYGEDIDLSYRITKGGYKNYYYPETTIIHYKGESTKKGSINYVRVFYNAMIIFARKHFSAGNANLFSLFINLAIYFRAFLALINRFVKQSTIPIIDAAILYSGFLTLSPKWQTYKFNDLEHFPKEYFLYAIPTYLVIWLLSIFFSGGYERPAKLGKIIRGLLVGTGIILIMYALLPETYRFSRAMLLMGTAWGIMVISVLRTILHFLGFSSYRFNLGRKTRMAIVGDSDEPQRVLEILKQSAPNFDFIGLIHLHETKKHNEYLGTLDQLEEIVEINKIDELVFCATDIPAQRIIREMLRLEGSGVAYKIAPPESMSIIGSNSIETAGDLYTIDLNNITKQHNLRKKRLFDITISLLLIPFLPILAIALPNRLGIIKNVFSVLFGIKTWVGFYFRTDVNTLNLPRIKKGILSWALIKIKEGDTAEKIEKLNLIYAKDYRLRNDLMVLFN
ncbi:MAG: glycosyltransferase [Salinivirgaceae bacterium]|jgi:GT2 family glycosyltransferase|nr:glycosyltransferase [Salinivirgaceae bacterium]